MKQNEIDRTTSSVLKRVVPSRTEMERLTWTGECGWDRNESGGQRGSLDTGDGRAEQYNLDFSCGVPPASQTLSF